MKRVLVLLLGLVIGVSLCSCDKPDSTVTGSDVTRVEGDTATTEPTENDYVAHPYFMKDGEVLVEAREPSEDAVTLYVCESCTITNENGNVLRIDFVPGRVHEGGGEIYDKLNEIEKTLPGNVNAVYGDIDVYKAESVGYNIGKWSEVYGLAEEGGLVTYEKRYAAELVFPVDSSFTVTVDKEAEKLECDYADENLERVSYCGTGLREIEVTPDKVILRGDVVTETDEDQSELDPSERMHLNADGREIVIEPYIEK